MKNFTHYTPNTVFEFGQYKGMTLEQIAKENASYILWCTTNIKKILNPKATTQHLIRLLCTIQLFTNTQGSPAIAVCCLHA
jgi:Holliday junction resolvasome RuvABC endonuclease subunit